YRQAGSALSLELGPVTAMGCPALQAQEVTVLASLPKIARVAEQGGKLLLLDSNREVLLTYTPERPAILEGPAWQATAFNDGTGTMTTVADGTSITATFARDTGGEGSLTGSSGCNTYAARYHLRGRTLTVAAPSTTRKTCAQPA